MSESRQAWIAQWPRAKVGVTLFCNLGFIFFQIFSFQIVLFQGFRSNFFCFVTHFLLYKTFTKNQLTIGPFIRAKTSRGLNRPRPK